MGILSAAIQRHSMQAYRVTPRREAPVEVQVMGRGSLDVLLARNVSETGIGVYVPHGFAGCSLDDEVELVITLPGERPFLTRGKIKHRTEDDDEGHHFGLQFSRMSAAQSDAIRGYVRSHRS